MILDSVVLDSISEDNVVSDCVSIVDGIVILDNVREYVVADVDRVIIGSNIEGNAVDGITVGIVEDIIVLDKIGSRAV
jgi:hypothetical protein